MYTFVRLYYLLAAAITIITLYFIYLFLCGKAKQYFYLGPAYSKAWPLVTVCFLLALLLITAEISRQRWYMCH